MPYISLHMPHESQFTPDSVELLPEVPAESLSALLSDPLCESPSDLLSELVSDPLSESPSDLLSELVLES